MLIPQAPNRSLAARLQLLEEEGDDLCRWSGFKRLSLEPWEDSYSMV